MNDAYLKTKNEVLNEYKTSMDGLSSKEARRRQGIQGKNVLIEKNKKSKLSIFLKQFKNVMIILLLVVGLMSLFYAIFTDGDFLEPIVILGTTLVNCLMGYFQESKAEDAIEKLKNYSSEYTTVKRDGKIEEINSEDLVEGDYIILEAGDKVPADARVIESHFAKCDEAILTGESLNVEKIDEVLKGDLTISECKNMIYSGTVVTAGKIEAIVVDIGMDTELGKIAASIDTSVEPITPLQVKIKKISTFISGIAAFLVAFVMCYGIIMDYTLLNVFMLAISMIVASVPECLPIAITATLSIGVSEMARKKSIVRNLAAIETLGATEVICTDKTGTLTTNKMEVIKIYTNNNIINLRDIKNNPVLIDIMALCNNAVLDDKEFFGDSVEVALANYLLKEKINVENLRKSKKEKLELPFDSDRKLMSVIYENNKKNYIYTKGSLENLIKRCKYVLVNGKKTKLTKEVKNNYLNIEKEYSHEALKVLAFAYKEIKEKHTKEEDYFKEENDLILVGLVGLKDPARKNVKEAIKTCREAGIRPIMLTGDNLETALAIGREVGIITSDDEGINATALKNMKKSELAECISKYSVFARVSPENKLQIVKALQRRKKVVAMTGDGVNDAPAMKLANVGIGMGKSGTDVTKNVADIILLDDSYNTITTAIENGRRIYNNVITNVLYNLSSNFTEIVIILLGMFMGSNIISAIHVLYIDLVADTIPSIALAFEGPTKNIMKEKPHGLNKRIFTPFFMAFLIISVILEAGISILVYFLFENMGEGIAQTMALFSIVLNEFVFAYNCRSLKRPIIEKGIFSNKYLNLGILVLFVIQIIVFFTPAGKLFGLEIINMSQFIFVILVNLIAFIVLELLKPIITKIFKDE
ncbi:MAG TPA: cation-transporting P-type ATPase [Candidatus Onthocola stercorigallinarum]|nr:cation-transporting P-type ATPase [Candidatus Onthocola stercorigallinarum]